MRLPAVLISASHSLPAVMNRRSARRHSLGDLELSAARVFRAVTWITFSAILGCAMKNDAVAARRIAHGGLCEQRLLMGSDDDEVFLGWTG